MYTRFNCNTQYTPITKDEYKSRLTSAIITGAQLVTISVQTLTITANYCYIDKISKYIHFLAPSVYIHISRKMYYIKLYRDIKIPL
jgi:hypothetical protein